MHLLLVRCLFDLPSMFAARTFAPDEAITSEPAVTKPPEVLANFQDTECLARFVIGQFEESRKIAYSVLDLAY